MSKRAWILAACLGAALVARPLTADEPALEPEGPTLKALMSQLEGDMSQVSAALYREDLEALAQAADAVAHHPRVSAAERQRIQGTLGADFGAFAAADHKTHEAAATLAASAKARDMARILTDLSALQGSCVSCHQQFRARLRS